MIRPRYVDLIIENLMDDRSNNALIKYIEALEVDARILDYLADTTQKNAQVLLPRECVENNLHCMRSAILMAEAME